MKVSAQSCVKNDTYNIFLQKNANMLQNILLVGLGSMAGGVARYLLSMWIKQILPSLFPWGTFIVNMSGCLLIGLLSGWLSSQPLLPIHHRLLFIIGFCGSFTTFSTFTMDNLNLLTTKTYGLFFLNISASIVLGLLCTAIGFWLTRR